MTMLMGKLHEALRAANVPEALAREAAEEAATGSSRLEKGLEAVRLEIEKVRLETEKGLAALRFEMEKARLDTERGLGAVRLEIADLRQEAAVSRAETKGELRRLEWMLAGLIAIALAVGTRYFLHG